jgi:ABC-type xylose transport system substrate-binding protein
MGSLKQSHPDLAAEFSCGHFMVAKSRKHFSAISIDQAHE